MPIWDDALTERDKLVFSRSGHGARIGFGLKPALIVIDATYQFVGDHPEPIMKSIERWPRSCGEEGWKAVAKIKQLLEVGRAQDVPIIYTHPERRADMKDAGRQAEKHSREGEISQKGKGFVTEIAPKPNDLIIGKAKPSAFFGTPLISNLIDLGVDTLILSGGTTSGCVRATAVDGYSYNYRVAVVQECVFDRGQAPHQISLFDLNAKYADVVTLEEILTYFKESSKKA